MKDIKRWFPWLLVIFWMAVIFYLSHQPAKESNKLSKEITEIVIETVEKVIPNRTLNTRNLNHIIRKNAHFFAYLILGILVSFGIRKIGIKGYKSIGLALAICTLYAITDEVHQLFVPGRGGQIKDVLIDSAGAFAGIIIYFKIRW